MQNLTKIFIFSLVYLVLYNLPLINFKHNGLLNQTAFAEFTLVMPALFIIFSTIFILLPRFLSILLIIFLFIIGAVATYFLMNFGKTLDNGVIIDLLSVETELASEYISWDLIIFITISVLVPIIIESVFSKHPIALSSKIIILIQLLCLGFVFLHDASNKIQYKAAALLDHPPFKHFYVTQQFLTKYRLHMDKTRLKKDLTSEYKVNFKNHKNNPLTVVLVIGESMRGDITSLNGYKSYDNMPLMSSMANLVSFPKAKSSATSTRNALPYMLTNAIPPDFDTATGVKGIISIFKHLGFKTSWIGNQGLFGYYDSNYASNALEADYVVSNRELRIHLNQKLVHDEKLLPYIKERLDASKDNNFMVIHLMGSHWYFGNRYPQTFGHKFTPVCQAYASSECSEQEILNSYHNTIAYTDYVLSLILKELSGKNAILIYASDHGFSLNENGIFGNAYNGPDVPKEQLSIEMFGWMSPSFVKDHAFAYQNMSNHQHKDISHDYIFHSLLDCVGVKAKFVDPGLSLCR
jgi:lipid A ethanolaminephosphotransferase